MENTTIEIEPQWMRKFIPIWAGQIFSLLGSGLVAFALVWWITQKTGSAALLATATFVAILPEVLLAPFAGALVDRLNRRVVMIVADASVAFFTLVLAILFAFDLIQVWHIFVVMFLRSVGGVFHWPAMQASTSLMVPDKHLARFAGLNQALRGGMNIIAPPLGALLMTYLKFYQVVSIDVITALIAISPLFFIHIPQPKRADTTSVITPKTVLTDVAEGFRYMKNWRGLLYLTFLAAVLNFLLAPTSTFLPLMVTQHFGKGVWELSLVDSIFGIGIVAGGLALGAWGGFKNKMLTSLMGVIGIGVGTLLFGIAPGNWFWLAVTASAVLGIMIPLANGPLQAIMQSKVAPEMQGRIMGTTNSICTMMMPLALLISAPVAELLGTEVWYWLGGSLVILMGVAAIFVPEIIHLERNMQSVAAEVPVVI
ncbi:MAG TPA: MFS transporter [Anaerolineaceae bacterium]|nr:MFS transporter [Anaerolineaceae bacterium]